MESIGQLNIIAGWVFIVLGILSGSLLGMWSFAGPFKAPSRHEDYGNLPRRLVRLAHVALFMLPLISIIYGQYIDSIPLTTSIKLSASYAWLTCMVGVPLFLVLASFKLWFKYLAAIPVSCGIYALLVMAYGQINLL